MGKNVSSNAKLIIANGMGLFIGSVFDTMPHRHHAIQITIGLDSNFELQLENELLDTRSVMINSDIEHRLLGKNDKQVLLLIEPESVYGATIRNILYEHNRSYLEYTFPPNFYTVLKKHVLSSDTHINEVVKLIFNDLNGVPSLVKEMDIRLKTVIEIIEKGDDKQISVTDLAKHVSLSESRLQHLFKEHIGISIKRYILWKKMIDGVRIIANNNNFTYSAHEAGFSDSSHISRTFKEMFGLTLSDLFKSSSSIQVFIDDY